MGFSQGIYVFKELGSGGLGLGLGLTVSALVPRGDAGLAVRSGRQMSGFAITRPNPGSGLDCRN